MLDGCFEAIKPALHNTSRERERATEAEKVLWIPPKSLITSVKDITAIIKVELNEIKMMLESRLFSFCSISFMAKWMRRRRRRES